MIDKIDHVIIDISIIIMLAYNTKSECCIFRNKSVILYKKFLLFLFTLINRISVEVRPYKHQSAEYRLKR